MLIGNKLSVHINPPQVRAIILSEAQAQEMLVAQEESLAMEGVDGSVRHGFELGFNFYLYLNFGFNPAIQVKKYEFPNLSI